MSLTSSERLDGHDLNGCFRDVRRRLPLTPSGEGFCGHLAAEIFVQSMELAPSMRHAANLGHAFAGQCVETCVVGTDDRDFPVAQASPCRPRPIVGVFSVGSAPDSLDNRVRQRSRKFFECLCKRQ